MSQEIRFPVEFIVEGTAISLQNKGRRSLREWQTRVKAASLSALPEAHLASDSPIAVTLYYFPDATMRGDVDNIVKPILDALNGHIYRNDRQVERVLVQKFEVGNIFGFSAPSGTLEETLRRPKPNLYVRLSDDPFEDLA